LPFPHRILTSTTWEMPSRTLTRRILSSITFASRTSSTTRIHS